ncbi:DUF3267 domain-containing protein [Bacillus xiapuensis]|uniref:DUF3267 domain-containing protein n=1 Tax=Bacillus xiapuensis TaxID=2014075 RepID=UPI000C23948A|nr:DUF3267 domain-containing protein [Bacillus xiapuensis]
MKCWRTFDFEKRYGFNKIMIFSFLLMMIFFSFSFAFMQSMYSETLYSAYFELFLIGLLAVYPLHKLVHILPVWRCLGHIKLKYKIKFFCLPVLFLNIKKPIPKKQFILCLLLPFFIINPALLICGSLLPHYMHYFTMLAAVHTGICALDFLYVKALVTSPKYAVIEEHDHGYEILIPQ